MSFFKYALFILGPCAVLQPLGMDIFISELPKMMSQLGITEHEVQYILASFVLASGFPQLVVGYLADKYGRRIIMLSATFSFAVVSLLCTVSNNLLLLSALRFLQGFTASAALVVSYSVIRDLYAGVDASKKYSQLTAILAITPMLAPLIGATLVDFFSVWQATFYFLVLFSLVSYALAWTFLPETLDHTGKERVQLKYMDSVRIIVRNHDFWIYCLSATTTMSGLFLYFSIGSILLMERLGLSSFQYSGLFAINAVSYLLSNFLVSQLVKQFRMRKLIAIGNTLVVAGAGMMILLNMLFGLNALALVSTNALITIGGGFITGPSTSKALAPFPNNTGMASGVFGTVQYGLPALLGIIVTRFEINSTFNLALPMLMLSLLNLYLLWPRKKSCY